MPAGVRRAPWEVRSTRWTPSWRSSSCTWRLISLTDALSSSAAEATDCTLVAASSDAAIVQVVSMATASQSHSGTAARAAADADAKPEEAASKVVKLDSFRKK